MALTTKKLKEIIKEEIRTSTKNKPSTKTAPTTPEEAPYVRRRIYPTFGFVEPRDEVEKKYFSREKAEADIVRNQTQHFKEYYPHIFKKLGFTDEIFKAIMYEFKKAADPHELPTRTGEIFTAIDIYFEKYYGTGKFPTVEDNQKKSRKKV